MLYQSYINTKKAQKCIISRLLVLFLAQPLFGYVSTYFSTAGFLQNIINSFYIKKDHYALLFTNLHTKIVPSRDFEEAFEQIKFSFEKSFPNSMSSPVTLDLRFGDGIEFWKGFYQNLTSLGRLRSVETLDIFRLAKFEIHIKYIEV